MFLLEPVKKKQTYQETTFRGWVIRTSSEMKTIAFCNEQTLRYESISHSDAIDRIKELQAEQTRNSSSKMFKTSLAANCNALFFQQIYARIGTTTGIELFQDNGLKLRLLRKAVFDEVKNKYVKSGGCLNITSKKVVDGDLSAVKFSIPKEMADTLGVEQFARYEIVHQYDDARGIVFEVKLHSRIDRGCMKIQQVAMAKPGFSTYG